ncbi:MAG: sigma-70 family RNA polymerase sigma factor [Gammaproteobacteria bacterium]|nr:sigma-70 family RNA polymerase sigma factor [Gammaproteobacteria bacterium]NBD95431.1 sigma-70 family RNA polymerase sigma factor [Gammaproteobacteria bacterium]
MNQALEQVIRDHAGRLRRIARQYAGEADEQDLLQEICLALWRGLDGFEGRSSLSTWVFRVAVNTALQFVRKRQLPTSPLACEPPGSSDVDDPMSLLQAFVAGLDPVNRAVLLLDLEGLGRQQIADVLGLTPGAVAVRMTRLKRRFEDEYVEDS